MSCLLHKTYGSKVIQQSLPIGKNPSHDGLLLRICVTVEKIEGLHVI